MVFVSEAEFDMADQGTDIEIARAANQIPSPTSAQNWKFRRKRCTPMGQIRPRWITDPEQISTGCAAN